MGVHILKSPLNLKAKDKRVFQHEGFGFPELNLFNLENVIITADGICVINKEIVGASIHHHRDRMELHYLMAGDTHDGEVIHLTDSQQYLIIHGPILTPFHWITESLPRLWMVKENTQNLTLLLPHEIKGTMLEQMLSPFHLTNIQYLPEQGNVVVNRLLLPELKSLFPIFDPDLVNQIRNFYFSYRQNLLENKKSNARRVYLKPQNTDTKIILNKDGIETLLKKMDFELLDLTKLNFAEYVHRLHSVDFLISADSDDLTCMQFIRQGASVLELKYDNGNDVDLYSNRFWHFASCLDLNYYYQFGSHTSYDATNHLTKGFEFDLDLLHENIRMMLGQASNTK